MNTMQPEVRQVYVAIAFTPMDRSIDRRAEYHLRHFDEVTKAETPKRPKALPWLVVEAIIVWLAVVAATWFLLSR